MTAMKAALLCLAMIPSAASTAAAEPLKVFAFTNEVRNGSVDEQLKTRRESLQDLVKSLSSPRYQKTLTLVTSPEGADVIIELQSRGETTTSVESGSTSVVGGATASASQSSTLTKQFLKFRISAGRLTHNLTTQGQLPWVKMAERAAEDLVKWILDRAVRRVSIRFHEEPLTPAYTIGPTDQRLRHGHVPANLMPTDLFVPFA